MLPLTIRKAKVGKNGEDSPRKKLLKATTTAISVGVGRTVLGI